VTGPTIRPQTAEDVDGVVDVLDEVAREGRWIATEHPFDRAARAEALRSGLGSPESHAGVVAEVDGRVVGSIGLHLAPYGVVELGMAILDGHRGHGLGHRLLDAGIGWARSVGAHKVALQVWPDNERAIALYRRAGFVEEGRLRSHYRRRNGELRDALVMGLLLHDE
jgi:RimJ/RimL family protein N-acetyltransferase